MPVKTLGVISDTHGLLRVEAVNALSGCDAIVHAGDIGKHEVLNALGEIAPVTAIRGNVDVWADDLPHTATTEIAGRKIYLVHDLNTMRLDPVRCGIDIVVSGHSHKPVIKWLDGILYVNPGSAGPRRFRLPIALARIEVTDARCRPEIVEMEI